ncbi:MAG: ParB/RepB/Spo0J family partition protein [Elusimicrobia bacterium]|nr:ParB/RepB/Spo0J family partition protein [Elusimicrobiota bacterium]
MTNIRLGRGLDVLIPLKNQAPAAAPTGFIDIDIESIRENPHQPRKQFDPKEIASLAESIQNFGVLEPVLICPRPSTGGYTLIAGERRLRAAKAAGLKTIPAIVKNFAAKESALVSLTENVQRKDLNAVELGAAVERMSREFEMTHEEIGAFLGMSRPRITNLLRLLDLPPQIKEYLAAGHLNEGQARALLGIENEEERSRLAKEIAEDGRLMTVRDLERRAKKPRRKDADLVAVEQGLEKSLATQVKIRFNGKKKSGWISIRFTNLEHFENLHDRLKKSVSR